MTPEERITQLEAQMAELLQRLNSAPSVAGAGSHLVVHEATIAGELTAGSIREGDKALIEKYQPKGAASEVAAGVVGIPELHAQIAKPLREQLVNKRIIWGLAGDAPLKYGKPWTNIRSIYNPFFQYADGRPQPGAARKYRLYAIYSDNMTTPTGGENQVRFTASNSGSTVQAALGKTWGGVEDNTRDDYSPLFDGWPFHSNDHARVDIRTTANGTSGILRYLELQAWDIFT